MTSIYPLYLETPRLRLREMQRTDAMPIWSFNQSSIHRQYEPDAPRTYDDFLGIVEWIISAQQERPRQYYYVVATLKKCSPAFRAQLGAGRSSTTEQFSNIAQIAAA